MEFKSILITMYPVGHAGGTEMLLVVLRLTKKFKSIFDYYVSSWPVGVEKPPMLST
jgi:hypothetical protein